MKNQIIVFWLTSFFLTGCASDGVPNSAAATRQLSIDAGCSEGNLKFHVGDSYLKVTPKNKCVDRGMTYIATIVSHGGYAVVEGDINITGAASWLNKSNTPNKDQIEIVVPNDAEYDDHKYQLEANDVGTLDPHVRVRK